MPTPPLANLEWRARAWLASLAPASIVRFLAYIPILITPPIVAIGMAVYLRQRPASNGDLYRHLQLSILIAATNIVLSAVILYNAGQYFSTKLEYLYQPFWDMMGPNPAPDRPPFVEVSL